MDPLRLSDRLTIRASSHLAWIDGIEDLAVRMARDAGLEADEACFFGVALREALVNAIQHGHRFDDHRQVEVGFRVVTGKVMVVTVRDRGPGFDPSAVADPRTPDNVTRPSGRGIFFMRRFSDRIRFCFPSSGGALVQMEKDLPTLAA